MLNYCGFAEISCHGKLVQQTLETMQRKSKNVIIQNAPKKSLKINAMPCKINEIQKHLIEVLQ